MEHRVKSRENSSAIFSPDLLPLQRIMNCRVNARSSKNSNPYFWRVNIGHEIDIIAERPGNLFPIEIKSDKTIAEEFFRGMLYWLRLSGMLSGAVVYAGGSDQIRNNSVRIVPWNKFNSIEIF